MKKTTLLFWGMGLVMLSLTGCYPVLSVRHQPIHPQNGTQVTFTAYCEAGQYSIDYVNILVNATLAQTCNPASGVSDLTCTYTGGPYTSDTLITYGANCYDTDGNRTWTGDVSTAYGTGTTYGSGKIIPIGEKQSDHTKAIDLLFFRDRDGGTTSYDIATFRSDIEDKIYDEYFLVPPIDSNWDKINFYYYYTSGTEASTAGCGTKPSGLTIPSWVDSWVVLHNFNERDCSTLSGQTHFSAEGYQTKAFVHESGHALFGLCDEYCCDSAYFVPSPNPNVWSSLAACQADATAQGWPNPTTNCRQICSGGSCISYWRYCPDPDMMANGHHTAGYTFHEACRRRINAIFGAYPEKGEGMEAPKYKAYAERLRQRQEVYDAAVQQAKGTGKFTPMVAATPAGTMKSLVVDLHIAADDALTFKGMMVVDSQPPDYVLQFNDILVESVAADGAVATSIGLWDPRVLLTESGADYLDEADFTVILPYVEGMATINFYDLDGREAAEKGEPVLSIDLVDGN